MEEGLAAAAAAAAGLVKVDGAGVVMAVVLLLSDQYA